MSKSWEDVGSISEVFWTTDHQYAFQRVGNFWNLYIGEEGSFLKDFASFVQMQIFIWEHRKQTNKQTIQNDFE